MCSLRVRGVLIPAALAVALFGLAGVAVVFARFDGGVAFVWPAASLLLAYLATEKVGRWPGALLACGVALLAEVVTVGLGWRVAPVLVPAMLGEPWIAAVMLCPLLKVGIDTRSVRGTTLFLLVAGVVAPVISGVPAAWTISRASHTAYQANLLHWVAGHGLGAVICTPIFMPFVSGDWRRHLARGDRRLGARIAGLLGLVALVSWAVFRQSAMPLLFLPLLPMVYATLQGGRAGAVLGVVILAAIATVHTVAGHGPIHLLSGTAGTKSLFLQAYIACAALLVLPIAALLAERTELIACWRESEARFRAMADSLGDTVVDVAPRGTIRYASPSIAEITGISADMLVGRPVNDLVNRADRPLLLKAYRAATDSPGSVSVVQYRGPACDAKPERWFEASIRALTRDGELVGVLGSVRDVSQRKAVELTLVRDASHDPLTGILNRRAFMGDLDVRCTQVATGDGHGSLALFDLDHFKQVNDRYGHAAGDTVLKSVAEATNGLVRGHDRVARIGGEEFAILFWGASPEAAANAAERVRSAVERLGFEGDDGQRFSITTSLGLVSLSSRLSPADTLKRADAALYDAKRAGRNCVRAAA